MPGFRYSDDVLGAFPTTRGGVIHAVGLDNTGSSSALTEVFRAEQARVRDALADVALSDLPSISAWRSTFSRCGVKPTQYRSASEALLRRLTKQGEIPSINPLVDIANLTSIRHRLPVAVFDQGDVAGVTTVRFSTGVEHFTDLGTDSVTNPEIGEVIFVDEAGTVSARRWCWRQSAQSAARATTVEALITVEGHHNGADGDVAAAVDDLLHLLAIHQQKASATFDLLSPSHTEYE